MPSLRVFLFPLAAGLLPLLLLPVCADDEAVVVPVPQVAVLPSANDWVTSLAFSPDAKTLAIGSKDSVRLIDVEKHVSRTTLAGIKGQVRALAFSPDGSQLLVGAYQSLQLWNPASGERGRAMRCWC